MTQAHSLHSPSRKDSLQLHKTHPAATEKVARHEVELLMINVQ
jgi:hypothetical protein